ncbi:recombinase family protein [Ferrimonas balearica]|uniref:recombinase family protein n=1 Tax=Ferrimonas balearica TaxID=44012 RepID=UPI001C9934C6|nr:recombinase family protein [Ferrimonas balearica]MBY5920941.1 recombinase family protein [Ferrimonas balearica]MBY5996374.1 recombinase family protein [Ferrimonas balearica]
MTIRIVRAYMRASTDDQNAERAREELQGLAKVGGFRIAGYYVENQSGTKVDRPELNRLISDCEPGDVLLVEKVDRLTRLPYEQWKALRHRLDQAQIRILVADQPMTYSAVREGESDGFITRLLTDFMLDLAAGMARDDYETRRKRQKQGIEAAKAEGRYKGRQTNTKLHSDIQALLAKGVSWSEIQRVTGCSRSTIGRVKKAEHTQG